MFLLVAARLGRRRARRRDGDPAPHGGRVASSGAGPSTATTTCPPCTPCRTALTLTPTGRRRRTGLACAGPRRAGRARVLRAAAGVVAGLPARGARPRLPDSASRRSGSSTQRSPYTHARIPSSMAALEAGLAAGRERMEQALKARLEPRQNGWNLTYHVFDYNLDFFEVGALDDDQWKLADDAAPLRRPRRCGPRRPVGQPRVRGRLRDGLRRRRRRAARRRAPLRAPLRHDHPAGRRVLVGDDVRHCPTSTWSTTRSTATRSATARRGCTTPTTARSRSSSSATSPPSPTARANWLPAPSGPFRPILRMYEPDGAVFDGRFVLPPITRLH